VEFIESNFGLVLLLTLFGVVLFKLAKDKLKFVATSKVTEGCIISTKYDDIQRAWRIQIQYKNDLDRIFIFESNQRQFLSKFEVGDIVQVRFDPKDPAHNYRANWLNLLGFEIVSILFCIVSLLLIY